MHGWRENICIGMGSDHGESHVVVAFMFHMDEEVIINPKFLPIFT